MPVVERIGTGQPVVFIHGSPGNRRTWARVVPLMPIGYSAWLMELAGHGSQPIGEGGLELYLQDVADVVRSASTPVVLVGLSLGGYVVLRTLHDRVPNVERAVVCAGPSTFTKEGVDFRLTLSAEIRAGRHTGETLLAALVDAMVPPAERDDEVYRILSESLVGEDPERIARFIDRVAEIGLPANRVGPYSTPTTHMIGRSDAFLPLAEAEAACALGDGSELVVVPTSSHMLPLSHPELVAKHAFVLSS